MKVSILTFLIAVSFISSLFGYTLTEVKDNATGETFPPVVTFDHEGKTYHLQATGVATRKKLIVNVYSVAHYLQEGANKAASNIIEDIMSDNNAKQLTIKWVRGVEAKKVQDGYQESFQKALSESEFNQLQSDIGKYIQLFNHDVSKGDVHILRWFPGGYVEVILNGKQAGSFTSKEFAKGLWEIWFGPRSVVNRDNLVSLVNR